jgi:hypothetical protein
MSKRAIFAVIAVVFAVLVLTALNFPFVVRPMSGSAANGCVNTLRGLRGAKECWALEHNKTTNDIPTWDDLLPYFSSTFTNHWWTNGMVVCPGGGIYTLGRVGEPPTCSIGGPRHSIPK